MTKSSKIDIIVRNGKIVKNGQNTIIIGAYASEYFRYKNTNSSKLNIPFYEIISTNYIQDVHSIRDELEKVRSKNNFISLLIEAPSREFFEMA